MPQMFPLFWFILFALAALSLLATSSFIHFIQDSKISVNKSQSSKILHNWKW